MSRKEEKTNVMRILDQKKIEYKSYNYLQTGAEGVYAAGDVTGLSGIWPNAQKQGETAALNMCGSHVEYTDRYAIKNTINGCENSVSRDHSLAHSRQKACITIRLPLNIIVSTEDGNAILAIFLNVSHENGFPIPG